MSIGDAEFRGAGAPPDPDTDAETHPADREDAGSKVVRGGAFRIAGFGLGTLLSIVGMVYVTRALGPADFGRFQTVLNILLIVGVISDVGLGTLGVREYSVAKEHERRQLIRNLLGLRLTLALIGTGIAVIAVVATGASSLILLGVAVSGAGLIISVAQTTLVIPLFSELRLVAVTGIDAARQGLQALGYVAVALAGFGLAGFFIVAIPVQVILLGVTIVVCWATVAIVPAIDLTVWRRWATAGLTFGLAAAVGITYQYTAQVVTAVVSSDVEAGLFAVALRIYLVVSAVPGLVVAGALPILSRSARDDAARFGNALRLLSETTLVVGGAFGVVLVVGAPFVVQVVGGSEFAGAVMPTRLLGAALVVTSVIATWGYGLLALHRHRELLVANAIALVSSLVLSVVLASLYGAVGATIATVIVDIFLAVAYAVFLVRRSHIAIPSFRPYAIVFGAFGLVSLMALVPGIPNVIAAVVAFIMYAAIVVRMRILPRELLDLAPPSLRRFAGWAF
jgi:O-antigen/teichoic acid export membrane protein